MEKSILSSYADTSVFKSLSSFSKPIVGGLINNHRGIGGHSSFLDTLGSLGY